MGSGRFWALLGRQGRKLGLTRAARRIAKTGGGPSGVPGKRSRALWWDAWGRKMLRWGRPSWALRPCRRATGLAPHEARLWLRRAAAAVRAGRLEEAALCYRALCRLDPANPRARFRLAGIYDLLGAPRAGLAVCRRAVELAPHASCLYRQLGRLLFNAGAPHSALRALARAAELNPQHCDTHYYVALALRRAGRLTEARRALRHALTLRPDDPKLYYALGLCCPPSDEGRETARLLLEGLAAEHLACGLDPPTWPPRQDRPAEPGAD